MRSFFRRLFSPKKNVKAKRNRGKIVAPYGACEDDIHLPPIKPHRLLQEGSSFFVTQGTKYCEDGKLKEKTIRTVFDFAYSMAFTDKGEHRNHRSGGEHIRRNGEIFANTFQGKIAECAICNYFYSIGKTVSPDFSVSKKGVWDSVDVTVDGREISVKSTKSFGQLLLLETKDWDLNGNYIPNIGKNASFYDAVMLVRMNPSCEDILKNERLLYSDYIERDVLLNILLNHEWSYNYVGFITHSDLVQIIRQGFILPKGALLNRRTIMDAENYYVQAGDFRDVHLCRTLFENNDV